MLLCNPFGEEASRAHRTLRVLATQLERAGYAALRFDYSGTGDSLGESEAGTVDAWVADIGEAAERLRAQSGAARLAVIGLRFGATLAALAAARGRIKPRHLLMWDPVLDGPAYLRDLAEQHRAYLRSEMMAGYRDRLRVRPADTPVLGGVPLEVFGAPLGDTLATQIAAIDLAASPPTAEQLTLLSTRTTPELERLHARLPASAKWLQLPASAAWDSDAALNAMTVPMDIVRSLVGRIEETSP